jgi:hypothetical protein
MLEILVNTFISLFKKLGGVKKLLTLIKTEKKTLIAIILWSMIIIPLTTFICYVFFKIITIQVNHDSKNPIAISRKEEDCYCPPCQAITHNYNNYSRCDFSCQNE